VTLAVYSSIALLLLTYVTAQVYTSALTQQIAELKQERHVHKEILHRMSSDYISLSSRARVTHYCESVLGMTQATDDSMERIAISDDIIGFREPIAFTLRDARPPDPNRFTLLREDGKSGQ